MSLAILSILLCYQRSMVSYLFGEESTESDNDSIKAEVIDNVNFIESDDIHDNDSDLDWDAWA